MSLEVSQDKTFSSLTDAEAQELYTLTRQMMLTGKIPNEIYTYFHKWCRAVGITDNLLTLSTAFTQYALLSVLDQLSAK